jgi:cbb3-type cytochrome oxidase subunit 3
MAIELRILTGARGGHHERFDQPAIALGRHMESDLRFDPNDDLDVSANHAEIIGSQGAYRLRDSGSTNGTFLNGRRIVGEEALANGDVIWLGAEGPQVEVHLLSANSPPTPATSPADGAVVRQPVAAKTRERKTNDGRRSNANSRRKMGLFAALVALMIVVAAVWYWMHHRSARAAVDARNDAAIAFLVTELDGKPNAA